MPTAFADARATWHARCERDERIFDTAPDAVLAPQGHRLRPGRRALALTAGEGRNGVGAARGGRDGTVRLARSRCYG